MQPVRVKYARIGIVDKNWKAYPVNTIYKDINELIRNVCTSQILANVVIFTIA